MITSNRPTLQSAVTVGAHSAHPKPAVSLEWWEEKAPLGQLEARSVNTLKLASEWFPNFHQEEGISPPLSPPPGGNRTPGSRPTTPSLTLPRAQVTHTLHPKDPIQSTQQFYDWLSLVERSIARSQEAHFHAYVADVSEHLEKCDQLINGINRLDTEVEQMLEKWRIVGEGGLSLKGECEKLLEEREKLLDFTEKIGSKSEYFQELEHAIQMLNHPGESLVLQTDFLYMVERVDICIDYMKSHRHYKEAEVYLLRYQQCMTRAMTLIKMYVVGSLRAISNDISKRMSEKDVSMTAQMHLLYTRFRSVSSQLAPLIAELERRARPHPEELSVLLSECHDAYFSARKSLLLNRVMQEIKGLDPARTELVELTRAGCGYIKQLCTDEFNLYQAFFHSGEDRLYLYLENLCDYLYDDLRPRILHEPRLAVLSAVCTVLQALMVLDSSTSADSLPEEDDNEDTDSEEDSSAHPQSHLGLRKLHISHLLQMILQDAQTRLFFKAQSIMQSEIKSFVPKSEDLAFPEKLISASQVLRELPPDEKGGLNRLPTPHSFKNRETWFPTVHKAAWILSQLHEFVKPAIFEDIAQEALVLCRQSLIAASQSIKTRNPPSSTLDGDLFLIRHYLILTENVNYVPLSNMATNALPDTAATGETQTSVLSTTFLSNSLLASLGMPRIEQKTTDPLFDIKGDLRTTCSQVISHCVEHICQPLSSWTERIAEQKAARLVAQPPISQPQQEWRQSAAEELNQNFLRACEGELREHTTRLKLYLDDSPTLPALIKHIQDKITDYYSAFRHVALNTYIAIPREALLSPAGLTELLRTVCNDRSSRSEP